jgi:hypothetical protein
VLNVILFPVAIFLLFITAVIAIALIVADPLPWIVALCVCFGVFVFTGFFFFRDVWREWRAQRRSKP